jgi:high-affinity nickel-transport protein
VREGPVIVAITKYPIVLGDSWVGLDRPQRRSIFGMVTTIVALHVVGWAALLFLVVPGGYVVQGIADLIRKSQG